MTNSFVSGYRLSGNMLKIIATLAMIFDHAGVILFPEINILRIIGRIAFPIYALMLAEGCVHTKNRLRYFFTIFSLGVGCQIVYYIHDNSMYMGILITFSLSILVVYALQYMKTAMFDPESSFMKRWFSTFIFLSVIAGVYILNEIFHIDYGFWGCLAPAFASLLKAPRSCTSTIREKIDRQLFHVLMFAICLVIISCVSDKNQPYSLLAIPLLMLYSGKRGKAKMKSFFYIFYPAHLVALECISYLLN